MTKDMIVVDSVMAVTNDVIDGYVTEGYKAEDVSRLETVANTIRNAKRGIVVGIVEIGAALKTTKDGLQYGSWQYFVRERCGLSLDTAQRYMASAALAEKYPELMAIADKFTTTGFAKLGQSKLISDKGIEAIVEYATESDEEINQDIVQDILKQNVVEGKKESKPAKPKPLGFAMVDKERGAKIEQQITGLATHFFAAAQHAGVETPIVRSNPDFKAMVKRISDVDMAETPMEKALHNLLYVAFFAQKSMTEGPDAVEIDISAVAATLNTEGQSDA